MFFKLAVVTFVYINLGMGQETCDVLQGLYESFQCRPYSSDTRYCCNEFRQNYRFDQCYHNGTYYANGEGTPLLPFQTSQLCTYFCDITNPTSFGPVLFRNFLSCVPTNTEPEISCYNQALEYPDYFYFYFLPVYQQGDECPRSWIFNNFPTVAADDCSSSPRSCCTFANTTLSVGRTFMYGPNIACECQCPPLVQCIETP